MKKKKKDSVVRISNDIIMAKKGSFTAEQLKMTQYVLSEINPYDATSIDNDIIISKKEYEQVSGRRLLAKELTKHTEGMAKTIITLRNKTIIDGQEEHIHIPIYNAVQYKMIDGVPSLRFAINPLAKEILIDLEYYSAYPRKYIKHLNGVYTPKLYWLLKTWLGGLHRVQKKISIDEFKDLMDIENVERYRTYRNIGIDILKKSLDEINNNTDIRFSWETEKRGNKVVEIHFNIEKTEIVEVLPNNSEEADIFSKQDRKMLFVYIEEYIQISYDKRTPQQIFEYYMKLYENRKDEIGSPVAWMRACIENDIKAETQKFEEFKSLCSSNLINWTFSTEQWQHLYQLTKEMIDAQISDKAPYIICSKYIYEVKEYSSGKESDEYIFDKVVLKMQKAIKGDINSPSSICNFIIKKCDELPESECMELYMDFMKAMQDNDIHLEDELCIKIFDSSWERSKVKIMLGVEEDIVSMVKEENRIMIRAYANAIKKEASLC